MNVMHFRIGIIGFITLLLTLLPVTIGIAQGQEGQVYTIQRSDTLWALAEKYLGDGNQFPRIIEATATQVGVIDGITEITNAGVVLPGQQVFIPAEGLLEPAVGEVEQVEAVETETAAVTPRQHGEDELGGHIAFSFWNNSPNRCTYEVNIIDVDACLVDGEQCQANRRIVPLNNISEPALSPNGDRLAFRGWGEMPTDDNPYYGCAAPIGTRFLGHTTPEGTEFTGAGGFWEDSHPDWSPDGNRLIFDTTRFGDGISRILVIGADGSGEFDLRMIGQQPSWGPDNERFVYRGCDLSGNACGIRLGLAYEAKHWETGINYLGSVVTDPEAAHPDWSPVDDVVVYQSPAEGSWDLYLVDVDGSNKRRLTTSGGVEGLPAWSPDGQWIAYVSFDGQAWSLRAINRAGDDDRLLFTYDGGFYAIPKPVEPYGVRDWLDEQISWSR